MKKYLFLLLGASLLYSCDKGGSTTVTTASSGTVKFTNASLYTYGISLNGSFKLNLSAGHSASYLASFGTVTWTAIQQTDSSVKVTVSGVDSLYAGHDVQVTIH